MTIELSQMYYLFHYVRNTWIFAHSLDEETETKLADLPNNSWDQSVL